MTRLRLFSIVLSLVAVGALSFDARAQEADCSAKIDALEKRIAALEQNLTRQLTAIDQKLAKGAPAAAAANPLEGEAEAEYRKISGLVNAGDLEKAKVDMAAFMKKYGSTNAARKARRTNTELQVIGKVAPTDWGISQWYQGESEVNLSDDGTKLLVFWETWCPHCQREVPKLQALYDSMKGDGLQVVGLTKVTKSATDEKVSQFIKDQSLRYPVAKEDGKATQYFNVSGVPAAAVVKGGKIVWRGHPARLNESILRKWL